MRYASATATTTQLKFQGILHGPGTALVGNTYSLMASEGLGTINDNLSLNICLTISLQGAGEEVNYGSRVPTCNLARPRLNVMVQPYIDESLG